MKRLATKHFATFILLNTRKLALLATRRKKWYNEGQWTQTLQLHSTEQN